MTEPKFTPGPWDASEHGDYSDYDGECIVILGLDTRICVVQGSDDSETYHNAHLIAAAPELYEALQDMHKTQLNNNKHDPDDYKNTEQYLRVEAALAKSRGESHD